MPGPFVGLPAILRAFAAAANRCPARSALTARFGGCYKMTRREARIDTLLFIAVIAVGGFIIAWYVMNAAAGDDGRGGLLALRREDETDAAEKGPRWRRRTARLAPSRLTGAESALAARKEGGEENPPAFRAARRGLWREKDAPGYRPKPPRAGDSKPPE